MKIEALNQEQHSLGNIPVLFDDLTADERVFLLHRFYRQARKTLLSPSRLLVFFDSFELTDWLNRWENPQEKACLADILKAQHIIFKGQNFEFDLTTEPIVYTIMNVTPDSFHDGAQENLELPHFLKKAEAQLEAGSHVLELGGKSSRPGYEDISPEAEWKRLEQPLRALKQSFPEAVIAIDTDEADVMERVLDAGADIINDINGFDRPEKLSLLTAYKPAVVVMNNGRQPNVYREDLAEELTQYFSYKKDELLALGLSNENICTDPGVGFYSKERGADSLERAKTTEILARLGMPVMIAISHKRFLSQDFGLSEDERMIGNLMLEAQMIADGGRVLRVHDASATKRMIDAYKTYKRV